MKRIHKKTHGNYNHLLTLTFCLIVAILLSRNAQFHAFLLHIGEFGYIGAFIAGVLFVSTFTIATSIVILFALSASLSPLMLCLIAGTGATLGNFLMFCFIKENIIADFQSLFRQNKRKKKKKNTYFLNTHWTLPVIGALLIASPLPDELGIGFLSMFNMKTHQFLLLTFILKTVGIYVFLYQFPLVIKIF